MEIRYNHFDLSEVFIYQNGQFLQKAGQTTLPRWNTSKKQDQPKPNSPPPKSGINHLAHLEEQHREHKKDQAQEMLGRQGQSPRRETFTMAHFFKAVASVLHRKVEQLHANELQLLQQAWNTYGPFQPPLVNTALAKAILAKGYDQHLSFYIQAIINSHFNHQNKNNQKEK